MTNIMEKIHLNGLKYLEISNKDFSAKIFFQGAQVAHFQPKGAPPILFMSESETFVEGKSLRGGAPICWPWFGTHSDPDYPQHGYVRNIIWDLDSIEEEKGYIQVTFSLPAEAIKSEYWPHKTGLKVIIKLSSALEISIQTENLDTQKFSFSQAVHTYFALEDISQLKVTGLTNTPYIEFGESYKDQSVFVSITKETDRVYYDAPHIQNLETQQGIIKVSRNSNSCVLWNPWVDKSKRLSNFNPKEYGRMVCLEACNVLNDEVTLEPGEKQTLTQKIEWFALRNVT